MQKNHWLRLGLATMILAGVGAGATLQGCSDDEITPTDGGTSDSTTPTPDSSSTSTTDANVEDTSVPPRPAVQKIIFVHAANYMGPAWETATGAAAATNGSIRICLKSGTAGSDGAADQFLPIPPLPNAPAAIGQTDAGAPINYTGLLRGTGGVLPASTDFSTATLTGFALNAQILAQKNLGNATCGEIFSKGFGADGGVGDGGTPLVDGEDYVNIGQIPAGTFKSETTYVVTVQGCAKGAPDSDPRCGTGYSGAAGNLKLKIHEVSRGAVAATELGVQAIVATPSQTPAGEYIPGVVPGGDAGAGYKAFSATPDGGAATVPYDAPITAQNKLTGIDLTNDRLSVHPLAPALTYTTFAQSVAATQAKTPVALGGSFVFVLVGDYASTLEPTAPVNQKLHFLAFPSNPTVPPLTQ